MTQSTLTTKPFAFTKPEAARITTAQNEINRLVDKLESISNLRDELAVAGTKWADGKLDMLTAAACLTATSQQRDEMARVLRPPIKTAIKAAIESVADLAGKAREHHIAELKRIANDLEATERKSQAALGFEEYEPSAALSLIRNQHLACVRRKGEFLSRGEVLALNTSPELQPELVA
jgi:hypothetical protein